MPELPEVESVRRGLQPFAGQTLADIEIIDSWLRKPVPSDLSLLKGQKLLRIERRAKYLIFCFERNRLVAHLGMTGRFAIRSQSLKHDKARFVFGSQTVYFNDSRRFGFLLWEDSIVWSKLGMEPLEKEFTGLKLYNALKKHKEPVKLFLLDQSFVVGLGNIYVCEALFRARISPLRRCCDISQQESLALSAAIKTTLAAAIEKGGSSLKDYRGVDGRTGDYQNEFLVYDRAGRCCGQGGQPCPGVQRIKQAGRSSYYCPQVQK